MSGIRYPSMRNRQGHNLVAFAKVVVFLALWAFPASFGTEGAVFDSLRLARVTIASEPQRPLSRDVVMYPETPMQVPFRG